MAPVVRLLASRSAPALTLEPGELTLVPTGHIILEVAGTEAEPLRLDGIAPRFHSAGGARTLTVNLSLSTGFHHLAIPGGYHFWFGTEDDKLKLDGIEQMLTYLRTHSLTWSGQIMFSDGGYLRDAHVGYGWLDRYADDGLAAAASIAGRPLRERIRRLRLVGHSTRPPALVPTIRLLRSRGHELLERSPSAPIVVGSERYAPRRFKVYERSSTIDTPANRRVVWLVHQVRSLCAEVLADPSLTAEPRRRCRTWLAAADRALAESSLMALDGRAVAVHQRPLWEDLADSRYAVTFEIATALNRILGWTVTREKRPLYSYVHYAHDIYQAFVGHVIAETLGLTATSPATGLSNPAFVSDDWECYLNVQPPPTVLRSWRSFTKFPDGFRPDILLVRKEDHAVVVADAKYRVEGRFATSSSRKEVMAYMSAYGLNQVMICFPSAQGDDLHLNRVAHGGRAIAELTISPSEGLAAFLREQLFAVLEECSQIPSWVDR